VFKQWFKDNLFTLIVVNAVTVCLFALNSCQSQVASLLDPTTKITRPQLQIELDHLIAQASVKMADLDRQDNLKKLILENALIMATEGNPNPLGILTAIAGALGVGASADNVRLRKKIANANKTTTTTD